MIVQEADRFGLAQLHQLRGRVGRGAEQSYCLLVSRHRDELSEVAVERLEAMVSTTDGFELAERDLEIRGEGQLVGARQSGLTDLRFTRLRADRDLLERAKELAAASSRARRSSTTRWSGSSARPSTSASRKVGAGCGSSPEPTGARGSRRRRARHTRPTGDRVREALFNLVGPGRRRVGARPLRRLGRARARGALARRAAVRVRRDGRGGVPR